MTPWTAACQASPYHTISQSLPNCMSIFDAIQPSHPLLLSFPSVFNLSQHHGLFQWVSSLHQVAKVLELQLQYQSCQWIFRVEFLLRLTGLIALLFKGLSKSLQHHRLKASILQHSAIFMFQLSHPYMTTGKTLLYGPLSLPYIYIVCLYYIKKYVYKAFTI